MTYYPNSFPKTCGCGASYSNIQSWKKLEYAGIWNGKDEFGRRFAPDLEMRHCICTSTIAVKIKEDRTDEDSQSVN